MTCDLFGLICNTSERQKCAIQIGVGTECNVACSTDGNTNHKGEICEGGNPIVSKAVWDTYAKYVLGPNAQP